MAALTEGLFQVTPRTLWESGPSSLKPKDAGRGSKQSSSNNCPLSRQLLFNSSKSWFRYFSAWVLVPIPWDLSLKCWSLEAIPDILQEFDQLSSTCGLLPLLYVTVCSVKQAQCDICKLNVSTPLIVNAGQPIQVHVFKATQARFCPHDTDKMFCY